MYNPVQRIPIACSMYLRVKQVIVLKNTDVVVVVVVGDNCWFLVSWEGA